MFVVYVDDDIIAVVKTRKEAEAIAVLLEDAHIIFEEGLR